jgi:trk system potassium uptake protein TrkA
VAAVRWSADQVLRRILPEQHLAGDFREPSGRLVLTEVDLSVAWIGHTVAEIDEAAGIRVAYVMRFGEGLLAQPGTAYQEGDTLHAMIPVERSTEISRILAKAPVKES